ncbi:methylamine utilization protein [Shewanella livingstonensis]|uniref:Methylamine utilization protein n=1 Tax=Shewanella livingstonensis TaxID=150120 RepID=A0A3G8LPM5_9GAMM|nr:methylamine utilization protein [Shewanella livingstonensis]AZG71337.1 methylamine utilization protein [Shewanella livingstonensis]
MPIINFTTCLLWLSYFISATVTAATLTINVNDTQGNMLSDSVVELIPVSLPEVASPPTESTLAHYEMRQQNRIFSPFVLAVPQGAKVDFPNLDRTRHHVYSFSTAKQFELQLYVGATGDPILFDKSGLVAIGCNIHDYMQAFIYVSKSPYFSISNEVGQMQLTDLPAGEYQVNIWHPWQVNVQQPSSLTLQNGENQLTISMDIERQDKPSAPPSGFGTYHNVSDTTG